jgi:predicted extracellular nuclease
MLRRPLASRIAAAFCLTLTAVAGISPGDAVAADGTVVITGVVDGPLTGGLPKVIEVYAQTDVPDLGAFGLEAANNGAAATGPEFTFPSVSVSAGTYLYVATESTGFNTFFGFDPDYTNAVASINGDDAIVLYEDGVAVDAFGVIGQDGTGEVWDHADGWAKRDDVSDAPTTTFDATAWTFSGVDALDGATTNATAATPFPIGKSVPEPQPILVINEIDYDNVGTDAAEFVEITNVGDGTADLGTATLELINGAGGGAVIYDTIQLSGSLAPGDYYVVCGNAATVANCDLDDGPDTNFIQNGAPDAVALLVDGSIVDTVSYEGDTPGYTEGTGGAPADSNTVDGSISRCPDGADTDQNDLDFVFTDTTPGEATPASCGQPEPQVTKISAIQGAGATVAITGVVTVEAIVTADYQASDQLRGFFIQEEDADSDNDPATSEAIFVFCSACPTDVAVGDLVSVTGNATEFFGMSQISATFDTDITVVSSDNPLPTPTTVDLPAAGSTRAETTFESIEGMVVTFPDTLVVGEYFELARYGHLVLNADERARQFTDANEPSVSGYADFLAELNASRIYLDDDNNIQNDAITGSPDEPYFWPRPGLSNDNLIRGGDSITGLTGVLHWSFAGQSGTDAWRVRPVDESYDYTFTSNNPRPAAPDEVGGSFKVASFNVLNYFTTIDSRGADSASELSRQREKIAAAICAMDADVVGLIEIENNGPVAISDLLNGIDPSGAPNGVNATCGEYAFVDTGVIGTDEITTAFIYRTSTSAPVGGFAVLDSSVDPRFLDDRNRPALAQTFVETASGAEVTVVVNHLKSKGSACTDIGDPDLLDGQGNCNATRTAAAAAMVDWLATDPTGAGSDNVLIMGDLNAYRNEDPIDAIEAGADDTPGTADDYTDLLDTLIGPSAYSYLFDGQLGYLDHALAGPGLVGEVTGATVWHVNADEIPVFDYNDDIRDVPGEASFERESSALPIYAPDAYRSSDHDPVIVGLDLNAPPVCTAAAPSIGVLLTPNHKMVDVEVLGVTDPEGGEVTITIDSVFQDESVNADGDGNTAPDATGIGTPTASVSAERSGFGDGRVYHIAFTAIDDAGLSCSGTVQVAVPLSRNGVPAVDGGPLFDSTIVP